MPQFRLSLLGRCALSGPDGPVDQIGRKLLGLLAVLACGGTEAATRDRLATLFWGSTFDTQARQSLRQATSQLRRLLGNEAIVTVGDRLALADGWLSCDAAEFESLALTRDPALLTKAVTLWRGRLFQDLVIGEEAWREWSDPLQTRFDGLACEAMVVLGDHELQAGRPGGAESLARRALAINDLREDAHRLLLRALADLGRRADALAHYDRLAVHLAKTLGAEPDVATRAVAAGLRAGSKSALPSAEPGSGRQPSASVGPWAQVLGDRPAVILVQLAENPVNGPAAVERELSASRARIVARQGSAAWLVEAPSPEAASALAFRMLRDDEGTPPCRVAGDLADGDAAGALDRLSALAPDAPADRLLATQEFRDVLIDGLNAQVEDLGVMGGQRLFSLAPASGSADLPPRPMARLRPAIAVLPVENAGGAEQIQTLAELLTDEVIGILSHSSDLDILSRLSTRLLAGGRYGLGWIRQSLGADYVVSLRLGSAADVFVELADTETQAIRWVTRRPLEASLAPVRDLASEIAAGVMAKILVNEGERTAQKPLASLEAYSLLFSAITLMDRWTRPSFLRARDLLVELRGRSPQHPLPLAWLAAWHVRAISQGWSSDAEADGRTALELSRQALDTDPTCSLALAMDGWASVHVLKQLDVAAERLQWAVEANPNDGLAWLLKGVTDAFRATGDTAFDSAAHAIRLSPLDPRRSYYDSLAATAALGDGQYERAIELARRSLRVNRMHPSTLRTLAVAHAHLGSMGDAATAIRQLLSVDPGFSLSRYRRSHPAAHTPFGLAAISAMRQAGAPD